MPTSYAAEPLCPADKAGSEPVPVWADPSGTRAALPSRLSIKRFRRRQNSIPALERLALIDAHREGRARERNLAEKELKNSYSK
jgi:hypothetical protein